MTETYLWATCLHLSGLTLAVIGLLAQNLRWFGIAILLMCVAIAGLYTREADTT